MSKVFYDHLIILKEVDIAIKEVAQSPEEKEELWRLVDEIVHHRVLELIFDELPREFHNEFLERFSSAPYNEQHIDYLKEKINKDVEKLIKDEVDKLKAEVLSYTR